MVQYIDEQFWYEALGKSTWYLILNDDFKRLEALAKNEQDSDKRQQIKLKAYNMVEAAVRQKRLPMASSGDDLDTERKPIDTIVIHHTKNQPGMTLDRLNAMQLLRIYGSYFANPTDPKEKHFKGMPIWSNHFYKGEQVFWGYHWLIREDGKSEHILDDSYIGWHAGNWDVNTRSIGICIDDDLTSKSPNDTVIRAIANTIRKYYPDIKPANVVGHCDVNKGTKCPGHLFHESWRQKLITQLCA